MNRVYHLEAWAIRSNDSPYTAPEASRKYLIGYRVEDGKMIQTSYIVKAAGPVISTKSGSIYILGEASPDYKKWLADNKISFDPNNPIKIK